MIDKKRFTQIKNSKNANKAKNLRPDLGAKVPTDPNQTIDVKNPEVEEILALYNKEATQDNLNKLINKLVGVRVLIPAQLNDQKQPVPLFLKSGNDEVYLPIYTSKEQLPKDRPSPAVMNMPFATVNKMCAGDKLKTAGLVINAFSNNIVFKKPLCENIEAVEKARAEGKPVKMTREVKLTEIQYVIFERVQFEHIFLPGKLFEGGKDFVTELSDRREAFIDQLYEESYQNKRMYPYIEEDFSVMTMQISDTLTVVRVDYPTRDMEAMCAIRAYVIWDDESKTARYFTRELNKEKNTILVEITKDAKRRDYGEAPVEGAELQTILDILAKDDQES